MKEKKENIFDTMEGQDVEKKTGKKKKHKMAGVLVAALCTGALAGGAFSGAQIFVQKSYEKAAEEQEAAKEEAVEATSVSSLSGTDVSSIVQNVMPAIVAIDTTTTEQMQVFGQIYSEESSGSGSGIIIGENDEQLLVVTNNHVIAGDNVSVKVTFADESTADAVVKGADNSSDLAVIAIDKSTLTEETKSAIKIATLGDSTQTQVGDMAIAIGNALGYGQSVTVGYVSAKDREIAVEDSSSMSLLQTDAAINPGNSGGALLNANGEVIGINSAKFSSEEVEGMGYAIPISSAVPIINELMNREQLAISQQASLGIMGKDILEDASEMYHMPVGVYVQQVVEGSAAEKAGIVEGNIITGINERTISSIEELQDILTYTKAGTKVTITIQELKDGEYTEKEIEVTLGSKSDLDSNTQEQQTLPLNPFGR